MNVKHIPNLFIVGAPKCGTTALSYFLSQNPNIFMSEEGYLKELNYFNQDIKLHKSAIRIVNADDYYRVFEGIPKSVPYLGDASPLYLYSKEAINNILGLSREVRLIVMLRNPIELAQSMHNQHAKHGLDVVDFKSAWKLQERRSFGQALPSEFEDGALLQYGSISKLGEQVQRLFKNASHKCIHIIMYEDFSRNPSGSYQKLLKWLDLPPHEPQSFPIINPMKTYRWPSLEKGMRGLKKVRNILGIPGGLGVHSAINRFNLIETRDRLSKSFEKELKEYFQKDIELLSSLLGKDFSRWLT